LNWQILKRIYDRENMDQICDFFSIILFVVTCMWDRAANEVVFHLCLVTPLFQLVLWHEPVPVVVRSKAWVYGRSLTGIVGSNPAQGMYVCLLCVLCVVR
jgi:hypothetical protein